MAYMNKQFVYEVVMPLVEVEGATIVGISTPLGKDNFYTEIVEAVDEDGQPVINVVDKGYVCQKCQKEGRCENGEQCEHSTTEKARWKKQRKCTGLIGKLMKNDPATFQREIMGITGVKKSTRCFRDDVIEYMFAQKPSMELARHSPKCILTLVDPSGLATEEGANSQFAALSAFYYQGRQMVSNCIVFLLLSSRKARKELDRNR